MTVYVPAVRPLSRKAIEMRATTIAARFFPGTLRNPCRFPVLDFFDCLRDFGLDPGVEMLSDGIEGATFPDGRVLLSEDTYRNAARGYGRARFTVAHECFHGLEHRAQIKRSLIDTGELVLHRRQDLPAYKDPEWQANTFAAAILMPATMVRVLAEGVSLSYLPTAIMNAFEVSREAAQIRANVLLSSK
jgi:hypothetical protein